MRLIRTLPQVLWLALIAIPPPVAAQRTLRTVAGVVRDTAGAPIAGAEVLIGERRATSNAAGVFQIDSLPPGQYPFTVRSVGYTAARSSLSVTNDPVTQVEVVLDRAPRILPTLVTEARRTGIYGTVSDSSYRTLAGARVQVVGFQGGIAETDSAGRFAFPAADHGAYLVEISRPGFLARRLTVELERGEGRELAVRLLTGANLVEPGDRAALQDLRLRLATGFRRERLIGTGLARWESTPLCDVFLDAGRNPVIIVNGIQVYRDMPWTFLCLWRADEVDLVEFGRNLCREASRTLVFLVHGRCGGYVVIWEKR